MLKPRYGNFNESIADFNRMLDGMNKTQPVERSFNDDLLDIARDEQELARLDNQIEHAHRVASGSGMEMSETESHSLSSMHGHAASMYSQAAQKAAAKVRKYIASQNPAMVAKMNDVVKRLKHKAQEHQAMAKRHGAEESVVAESKAQDNSLMHNMRVLAGLEERVLMPRDPGVFGTTRFNEGYEEMAQPFDEGGGSRTSKPERQGKAQQAHMDKHGAGAVMTTGGHVRNWKSDLRYDMQSRNRDALTGKMREKNYKRFGQAYDDRDVHGSDTALKAALANHRSRGHEEDVELEGSNLQESDKWAGAAVKRPGRLHKYFGVPPDKKIPMSKIKAAYDKLKDKENKSASEVSLMRALALGIRFKGGDVPGGQKKKGLAGD